VFLSYFPSSCVLYVASFSRLSFFSPSIFSNIYFLTDRLLWSDHISVSVVYSISMECIRSTTIIYSIDQRQYTIIYTTIYDQWRYTIIYNIRLSTMYDYLQATLQQHLHMKYICLNWSDMPKLVHNNRITMEIKCFKLKLLFCYGWFLSGLFLTGPH
jgi:hypothetical protein